LPIHGNVLVSNGSAYFTAGRSSYLDGGINLYRINARLGKVTSKNRIFSPDPETGKQHQADDEPDGDVGGGKHRDRQESAPGPARGRPRRSNATFGQDSLQPGNPKGRRALAFQTAGRRWRPLPVLDVAAAANQSGSGAPPGDGEKRGLAPNCVRPLDQALGKWGQSPFPPFPGSAQAKSMALPRDPAAERDPAWKRGLYFSPLM